MKSGTSSLHSALDRHPDVFMPPHELFVFDADAFKEHPNLWSVGKGAWRIHRQRNSKAGDSIPDTYLSWYRKQFKQAPAGALCGEDTTTYLTSEAAAHRIRQALPGVRLIFMLRDPVARAYSHYWHLVRHGDALLDFESTLHFAGETILRRGAYAEGLRRYYDLFPVDRIHIVLFEEFVSDMPAQIRAVTEFLGLSRCEAVERDAHANKGQFPTFPRLRLMANRWTRRQAMTRYADTELANLGVLVGKGSSRSRIPIAVHKLIDHRSRPPVMDRGVRKFLEEYYLAENEGLEDIVGGHERLRNAWRWWQ